jgi:hypothetical protein
MHQQWPERSHVNGVPHRAQLSVRCVAGLSDGFVTIPFTILPNPSCDVHALQAHIWAAKSSSANLSLRSIVSSSNGA